MFAGELKAAANKLQREQAERSERERQRLAKERLLAERQRQRQAAREQEARERRLQAAAAAAAEEERHAQELEENRGVALRMTLAAAPGSAESAVARGIKRAADKLVLPPSVGASLMAQDAPKNGAMLFELAAGNGAKTHAGVLEFTAPEGVVLLPAKVVSCLWGLPGQAGSSSSSPRASAPDTTSSSGDRSPAALDDASWQQRPGGSTAAGTASSSGRCCGSVFVRYKRLEKGTYVRFQPELRAFHEVVGADPEVLRHALESCLLGYCTLSEGDWVQVAHEGVDYNLRVLELQPAPAVSVIDTDIAADVGPSIETEGYLRAQQEAAARDAERRRQQQEQADKAVAEALAAEAAAAAAEQARQAEEAARRLQLQADKAALVGPELPADSQLPAAALVFRLPDGSRLSRRFALEARLQELYDFLDSKGAGGLWPGSYRLVLQYPRMVLAAGEGTLIDAGLQPGQQAVFLERLEDASQGLHQ